MIARKEADLKNIGFTTFVGFKEGTFELKRKEQITIPS